MRKNLFVSVLFFSVLNFTAFFILQYAFFQETGIFTREPWEISGKKKLIYLATGFFGGQFNFSELPPYCETSTNPEDMQKADAAIFHYFEGSHLFDRKTLNVSPDQVWVLVMYESAYQNVELASNDDFNWTMTYRRDSEIHSPYCGSVEKARKGKSLADVRPDLENLRKNRKTLSVAWMVSNCFTGNDRMGYAKELSNYVHLDIYGGCGHHACPRGFNCWEKLASKYKFYLSFENSHCKDYITEKLINPLYYGMLPIVYGGASKEDYRAIAPPHSYIDTRDFASPKELARYLVKLEMSPQLYESYFEWRKHYMVFHQRAFVGQDVLCRKLWYLDSNRKSYTKKELNKWWRNNSTCVAPPPAKPTI